MKKLCTSCNIDKDFKEYNKHRTSKYGLKPICRSCQSIKHQEYKLTEGYKKSLERNRLKNIECQKQWRKNNPEKYKLRNKKAKLKIKNNPFLHTKRRLRKRIWRAFSVTCWNKHNTTKEILGCDFETAFKHLENQFTDGMSWDNRSEWHIDHIIPLASAKTEEELIKLSHYTNLQPLWAEDNLKKGCKIITK